MQSCSGTSRTREIRLRDDLTLQPYTNLSPFLRCDCPENSSAVSLRSKDKTERAIAQFKRRYRLCYLSKVSVGLLPLMSLGLMDHTVVGISGEWGIWSVADYRVGVTGCCSNFWILWSSLSPYCIACSSLSSLVIRIHRSTFLLYLR